MEEILNELKIITANAKRKVNQPYSKETVENKRKEIVDLETKYKEYLVAAGEGTENLTVVFEQLKEEAINTLDIHLNKRVQKPATIMTNLDLNELSLISKFIPIFNGKKEDLHNFISNLELVHQTIAEEKKQSFFTFVFGSRLELKVQNRVKQSSVPTTVEDLITALKASYGPTKSANTILNELTKISQRNNNLSGFATKIETLVTELNEIQITEEGETNRSSIMNTNADACQEYR